jgi:hypothetical protein
LDAGDRYEEVALHRIKTIRKKKKTCLEAKGWKFGLAKEFLSLSDEEAAYIELKTRLVEGVRR